MRTVRWTLACALMAISAGCGDDGGNDDAAPTSVAGPPPQTPEDASGGLPGYDIDAALLALFDGKFPEVKASAQIDGVTFDLEVTPQGESAPAPLPNNSTAAAPTYRSSHVGLHLTANGVGVPRQIGYLHERAPTRLVGATMSTPRTSALHAEADQPYPGIPTAAAIGAAQELLRGSRYELNYWANSPKPPTKVRVPGSIARGWRLDPENSDSAFLCLIDEVNDGAVTSTDDYCYSIRRDGRPTGRFRATLTVADTAKRHEFE